MAERTLFLLYYLLFSVPIAQQPHKQLYIRLHLLVWFFIMLWLHLHHPSNLLVPGCSLKGRVVFFLFILSYQQIWVSEQLDQQHLWESMKILIWEAEKESLPRGRALCMEWKDWVACGGRHWEWGSWAVRNGFVAKINMPLCYLYSSPSFFCLKEMLRLFWKLAQANNGVSPCHGIMEFAWKAVLNITEFSC